jgi:hypothetical protein
MGDQPVARLLPKYRRTQTQKNVHTYETSMPELGFKPTMRASARARTVRTLNRSATVIGNCYNRELKIIAFGLTRMIRGSCHMNRPTCIQATTTPSKYVPIHPSSLSHCLIRYCYVHNFDSKRPISSTNCPLYYGGPCTAWVPREVSYIVINQLQLMISLFLLLCHLLFWLCPLLTHRVQMWSAWREVSGKYCNLRPISGHLLKLHGVRKEMACLFKHVTITNSWKVKLF